MVTECSILIDDDTQSFIKLVRLVSLPLPHQVLPWWLAEEYEEDYQEDYDEEESKQPKKSKEYTEADAAQAHVGEHRRAFPFV